MIKLRLFDIYEKFCHNTLGPLIRSIGKNVAISGLKIQGDLASDDRLVPSLRARQFKKQFPQVQKADFIAPNAVVIGQVQIGEKSSIWYGTTLRGDQGNIQIGNNSVLQDLVNIFPHSQQKTTIGDNVFVGPNAYLENVILQSFAFVGMGATVRKNAQVDSNAVVAAGAVIGEGVKVPSNQIWAGNPARYLRDITPEEKQVLQEHLQEAQQLARIHSEETEKSFREILNDIDEEQSTQLYDEEQLAIKQLKELGFPMEADDEEYVEQRVFLKEPKNARENSFWKKHYDPYEQDLYQFPDSFKQYGENYEKYEEIKKFFEQNPNVEAKLIDTEFKQPKENKPWTRKF